MKILLAEAVTKIDRLEQCKNNCKNCKSSTHTTPNCNQPCKICQGSLSIHAFWKCPNYNIAGNRSNPSIPVANTTNPSGSIEHVLLEDDNDFDPFSKTLKDLLAHEETQSRKRVRVEDIEDEDNHVKILSIASSASNPTVSTGDSKSIAAKRSARPRNLKVQKTKSFTGKQCSSTINGRDKAFSYIATNL